MLRRIRRNTRRNRLGIQRNIRDRENPLEIGGDEAVRSRYRFRPNSILFLCDNLNDDLERLTGRSHALPVLYQVCIALRFLATGSFQIVIGDTVNVAKSTVSRAIRDVTVSIVNNLQHFIKFPRGEEVGRNIKKFFEISGFPSVVGCVDGTQIRIQAPNEREEDYVCRKGYHSINVQLICDPYMRITNVVAKWPGSVHDSRIFRDSVICRQFEAGEHQGLLLGDSAYPLRSFIMTPFQNPRNVAEELFNQRHISTRLVIEQLNGVLKRVFGCLHGELRVAPDRCCTVISACTILYNVAIDRHDIMDVDFQDVEVEPNWRDVLTVNDNGNDGRVVRDRITRIHMT